MDAARAFRAGVGNRLRDGGLGRRVDCTWLAHSAGAAAGRLPLGASLVCYPDLSACRGWGGNADRIAASGHLDWLASMCRSLDIRRRGAWAFLFVLLPGSR